MEIIEDDLDDFGKDFYKEFNRVISKSDRKWTFVGHIDEFVPSMKTLIPELLKTEAIYSFGRYECCNLCPLTAIARDVFVRLFPTEWKLGFIEKNHIHIERFDFKGKEEYSKFIDVPCYHLGRCRNIQHIRHKEVDYEKCSGWSVLGSKYSEEDRANNRSQGFVVKDNGLFELLL